MGQAQKKFSLRIPLEIIDENQIGTNRDLYCYLMNNDVKQGPYLITDVEKLIAKNPELTAHIVIVDMQENTDTHPIGTLHSLTDKVFLLINGQKNGPFTTSEIAKRLEKKQKNLVKAIVLAVWALNANKEGKFSLSDIDALYIENSAKICSLSLSDSEMELSGTIILELIEKGLIISSP